MPMKFIIYELIIYGDRGYIYIYKLQVVAELLQ